jgi:hypothetical protein
VEYEDITGGICGYITGGCWWNTRIYKWIPDTSLNYAVHMKIRNNRMC